MTDERFPRLLHTVLDCTDPRALAEFYRQLLGLQYRPGHEVEDPTGDDWLVLRDGAGQNRLAFQQVAELPRSTWPEPGVPQQLHLDLTVSSAEELDEQHRRALQLGAELILDRSTDPEEALRAYADPAGHPFCIFVAPEKP